MAPRGTATPHRKDDQVEDRPLDPRKLARICLAQPEHDRFYFLNALRPDVADRVQALLFRAPGTNAAEGAA